MLSITSTHEVSSPQDPLGWHSVGRFFGEIFGFSFPAFYWIGSIATVIVTLMGIGRRFLAKDPPRNRIKEFLEEQANRSFTLQEIIDKFDYKGRQVREILESLTQSREVLRSATSAKYFFPRYEITALSKARDRLRHDPTLQRHLPTIGKKLSFDPEVESQDCVSMEIDGEISWLLAVDNFLVVYIIESISQLEDPLVVIRKVE